MTTYQELNAIALDLQDLCDRQARRIAKLENAIKTAPAEAERLPCGGLTNDFYEGWQAACEFIAVDANLSLTGKD